MKNPTIVLVHGAFADASGWAKVILGLEELADGPGSLASSFGRLDAGYGVHRV